MEDIMGPFPHDAPPATISPENPAGTDGFEFVEFAHPRPQELVTLFERMGYVPVARHKSQAITVYRQGDINYIVNADPNSFAGRFVAEHGPCAASMAWRVVDARHAFEHAVKRGAEPHEPGDKTLHVPAIRGIGGSLIYFVDRYGTKGSPYTREFVWLREPDPRP
jgi:4-hydroxyphenylpyruvate dioxygenase